MKKKGMETWFAYNFVLFSLHGIRYFGKYKKRNLFVCLAFLSKSKEMSSESHPSETKTDIRPTSRCDAQPKSVHSAQGAAKMSADPEGHKISQEVRFLICRLFFKK